MSDFLFKALKGVINWLMAVTWQWNPGVNTSDNIGILFILMFSESLIVVPPFVNTSTFSLLTDARHLFLKIPVCHISSECFICSESVKHKDFQCVMIWSGEQWIREVQTDVPSIDYSGDYFTSGPLQTSFPAPSRSCSAHPLLIE